MIGYFETSAIVKLLIAEAGHDVTAGAWDATTQRLTSVLAYAEARAALAAAHRSRRLTPRNYETSKIVLEDLISAMSLIEVPWAIARSAGDLAERHGLRGFDAVHLASALASDPAILVTWDHELARAARASGLDTVGAG